MTPAAYLRAALAIPYSGAVTAFAEACREGGIPRPPRFPRPTHRRQDRQFQHLIAEAQAAE